MYFKVYTGINMTISTGCQIIYHAVILTNLVEVEILSNDWQQNSIDQCCLFSNINNYMAVL